MIQIPGWAMALFVGYLAFTLVMAASRAFASWRASVHAKKEKVFLDRASSILEDNMILKDRMKSLEEANQSLQEEVCTLIRRNIQMCNELRCDDGSKTQVFRDTDSGRFSQSQLDSALRDKTG